MSGPTHPAVMWAAWFAGCALVGAALGIAALVPIARWVDQQLRRARAG